MKKIDLLKITMRKARMKHCSGCNDNFYNGNNPHGVKQCWLLDKARLVRRKQVHINDIPPWTCQPVVVVPDCYRKRGYVFIEPRRTC